MTKPLTTFLEPTDFPVNGNFPFGAFLFRKYGTGYVTKSTDFEYSAKALELLREKGELIQEFGGLYRGMEGTETTAPTTTNIKDSFSSAVFLYNGCLVSVNTDRVDTYSLSFYTGVGNPICFDDFVSFIVPPPPPREKVATMSMLMSTKYDGPQFFEFSAPLQDVNIALSYGEQFVAVDELIQDKLSANKSGLYIFRGPPGTGKSTYIKYLSQKIDREILLIPNNMGHLLADPNFLSLLINKQGAVIVLEDAEKVIQDRNLDSNSPVSSLLNLTDGFLGNVLNISIILTFNCDKQHMDKALLRKGRLSFDYEFNKLPIKDAQNLLDSLKVDHKATESMSLADIFFIHDKVDASSIV